MLGALLCNLFVHCQQPEARVQLADPLHHFVELEVGAAGAVFEIRTDFEGTLHVWAESEGLDPVLFVRQVSGESLEDDNSGGGTTAYIEVSVKHDDRWTATVSSSKQADFARVALHWVAAPETPDTRAAALEARACRERADARLAEQDQEGAHVLLEEALSILSEASGSGSSSVVDRAAWDIEPSATRSSAPTVSRGLLSLCRQHRERTRPKDHPDLFWARAYLGVTLRTLGEAQGARALLEIVRETAERLHPDDHPDVLWARANLAAIMVDLGEYAAASALFETVLDAHERRLPEDPAAILHARLDLAITLRQMEEPEDARVLLEQALAACEQLLPEDNSDVLFARGVLAATMLDTGEYEGSHTLFQAVLEVYESFLPEDHPDVQRARQDLVITKTELGDLAGAQVLGEATLAALEGHLPETNPRLQDARMDLASTLEQAGDLAGARALIETVLKAREQYLAGDPIDLIRVRARLAGTIKYMGDLAGARVLEEGILEACERLAPDHPLLLAARTNLANTMGMLGEHQVARRLFEAVLEVRQRLLPRDHPDLLSIQGNLSITLFYLDDLERARALGEAVLEGCERTLPRNHSDIVRARHNLANTLEEMGDFEGACALQASVLEACELVLPQGHPRLLDVRKNLAMTQLQLGDLSGAGSHAEKLAEGLLVQLISTVALSPREIREAVGASAFNLSLTVFLSELAESGRSRALLFTLIETWRRALSVPVRAVHNDDPAIGERRTEELDLRRRLNDLVAGGLRPDQTQEDFAREVSQLSLERDRMERELRSASSGRGVPSPIDPQSVAAGLAPEGVAIGFRRLQGWGLDKKTGELNSIGDRIIAHVVRPDGSLRRFDLGSAKEIEELIRGWRAGLGVGVVRGVSLARKDSEGGTTAGEALGQRLLAPILATLDEECTQLHICSDEILHLVPMDALPFEGQRVGDRWTVVNEVSFGRLLSPTSAVGTEQSLLALGGAAFGLSLDKIPAAPKTRPAPVEVGGSRSGALSNFSSLEHTLREVEATAALFEQEFERNPVLLTGAHVTKSAFHELAPSCRYLHLATHGWFAPESVPSMLDEPEEDDLWTPVSAGETVKGLAPSTLCGLAFAGANRGRDELGRVPGIMTAEELAGIDLRACELAVLSACETNVGIRRAGQGMQSLQSALHAAGVRTTITSLWKVDDAATQRLMELFYTKLWVEKQPKAEALWEAKRVLRDEGAPVRDWAGWVLTGDPR